MVNSYNIDSFTTTSWTAESLAAPPAPPISGRTLDKPRTLDKG